MCDLEETQAEKRLKILLVGDSEVGKTNVAIKFCCDDYTRQYTPTAGVDVFLKNLSLGPYRNINIYLWDVSGLALRGNMLDTYTLESNIILLIYDVTNNLSFNILREWMSLIKRSNNINQENPLLAVVGNKCDLEHQRIIKREKSHRFAAENGLLYFDISAKTGESVSLCIINLAAQVLGIKLTRTDQDFHRPIVTAEIGDTVDMSNIERVVKRQPNKKQLPPMNPCMVSTKTVICSLQ